MEAALQGAQEVTFTVISMSISLVAVFFPVLLLGGLVGRVFHRVRHHPDRGDRPLDGDLADA